MRAVPMRASCAALLRRLPDSRSALDIGTGEGSLLEQLSTSGSTASAATSPRRPARPRRRACAN